MENLSNLQSLARQLAEFPGATNYVATLNSNGTYSITTACTTLTGSYDCIESLLQSELSDAYWENYTEPNYPDFPPDDYFSNTEAYAELQRYM